MIRQRKSLIDNWSLESAALLLDTSFDYSSLENIEVLNSLGNLSNYINSLLLYDKTGYLKNGFESSWQRFDWFSKNTGIYIEEIKPDNLNILWESEESYADKGISNYLLSSEYYQSDLFISTERSNNMMVRKDFQIDNNFFTLLRKIDEKIRSENDNTWFDNVKLGVEQNFILPSLTQYVLSQASNRSDLLKVIVELKEYGSIRKVYNKIDEITTDTKSSFDLQKEVNILIKNAFGEKGSLASGDWSISLSAFFLSKRTYRFFKKLNSL